MKRRSVVRSLALLATVAVSAASPVRADVVRIDPQLPPAPVLGAEESARLQALTTVTSPSLLSDVSPDDAVIFTINPTLGPALLDIHTGAATAISPEVFGHRPRTPLRWRDASTMVTLGASADGRSFFLLSVARADGRVTSQPLDIGGATPLQLSPHGTRLLLVRVVTTPDAHSRSVVPAAPFETLERQPGFRVAGKELSDLEALETVHVMRTEVLLMVRDLATGQERRLLELTPGAALAHIAWAANDSEVSIIRSAFPDNRRGGVVPLDSPTVLDGLGRLAPADNVFLTSNRLDLFDLSGPEVVSRTILPEAGGPVFFSAHWSPTGRTLLVRAARASHPRGRAFGSYANAHGSSYRLYTKRGQLLRVFRRPEIASLSLPFFVSPTKAIFVTVQGPDMSFHALDTVTGHLRRLPTADGSIFQIRATNRSREMIYTHSSFLSPPEAYRIGLHDRAPQTLTRVNATAAQANQVQVRRLRFEVRGERRDGYLVQPRGTRFPSRQAPLIVWQEGGPTAPMTNAWGGRVESPFNILANFGFSVLMVPLQGRYGRDAADFDALAANANFGQVDIDDQKTIVRQLVRWGFTSNDRVGITGCSYGGYFASQSLTRHPGLYAAANPQCSLLDLVHEFQFGYTGYLGYLEGRTLLEDEAEFRRDSPVYNTAGVTTPTLIFAGTRDFLPWEISGRLHDGIEAAGAPVRFMLFENEPHGLVQRTSQRVAAEAQILWFRQYLNGH